MDHDKFADWCRLQKKMTPTGAEQLQQYSVFVESAEFVAKIEALSADSDFATIAAAWPTLPDNVRAEIVRLIEQAQLAEAKNLE
jgi:hypothetical protein